MNSKQKISNHFIVAEALVTTHKELVPAQWKHLTPEIALNFARLAHEILEPLRDVMKRPITPTSWLRCPELNAKVGGSPTSQHCTGLAADITIPGADLWVAYEALEFAGVGQRIIYVSAKGAPKWLHVSLPDPAWKWDGRKKGWKDSAGFRQRDLVCLVDRAPKQYLTLDSFRKEGNHHAVV